MNRRKSRGGWVGYGMFGAAAFAPLNAQAGDIPTSPPVNFTNSSSASVGSTAVNLVTGYGVYVQLGAQPYSPLSSINWNIGPTMNAVGNTMVFDWFAWAQTTNPFDINLGRTNARNWASWMQHYPRVEPVLVSRGWYQ